MVDHHRGRLIDTTKVYLRILYELDEEGVPPLRVRVGERVGHVTSTVTQTIVRMEHDGLLRLTEDHRVELSENGRAKATTVIRKHRLVERFLTDVVRIPWHDAHRGAFGWEHVVSEPVERRIARLLAPPLVSPYGNPIPGLPDLGIDTGHAAPPAGTVNETAADSQLASLTRATAAGATPVTIARISEWLQDDAALLRRLRDAGVLPGRTVTAAGTDDGVDIASPAGRSTFTGRIGDHIFVQPHAPPE